MAPTTTLSVLQYNRGSFFSISYVILQYLEIPYIHNLTHVVCVNFIHEWRDLQFNIDSERQIFEKHFHGRFIYSQSFCQKSAVRKSPEKNFFSHISFLFLAWNTNPGFTSNKPTNYLLTLRRTELPKLHNPDPATSQ